MATRRTLDREEAARLRYSETGCSLENRGCIGDPHIVVDRCVVFLCILHCCMDIGRLQVALIQTRLVDLPEEKVNAVQRVLYRARTGVKLGVWAAPNGEEARALFLAWEELGPLLDYIPEDGEWQAVVAMRDLLWELYTDKPPRGDLRAAEVARAHRAQCCKEACQSNYLLYLEEDITEVVANAYNDHLGPGGGGGAGGNPTRTGGGGNFASVGVVSFENLTSRCATTGPPIPPHAPWPNPWPAIGPRPHPCFPSASPSSPCHGRVGNAKDVVRHVRSQQLNRGVFCLCTLACGFRLTLAASWLLFRD